MHDQDDAPRPSGASKDALTRRHLLKGAAATGALAALGLRSVEAAEGEAARRTVPKMPVGYVSHGSPMTALDAPRTAAWAGWTAGMPTPVAVLVISAHFQRAPITLGATSPVPLIYDFSGFPRSLYQLTYTPPGAPKLATRVQQVLKGHASVRQDPRRGHDHGTWVPLRAMYAQADVPVLSLSLPSSDPKTLFKMGQALRPLRDEGVFLLASGAMTHNLRYRPRRGEKTPAWAAEFDTWVEETLVQNDVDALLDWQKKAPAARTNHPTVEHFTPLLIAAGARKSQDVTRFPLTGFDGVAFSRRCVSFETATPATG
jgi:4,5-DOPA dioxygenase extradiol